MPRLAGHLAHDQRHVLGPVHVVAVADHLELAEIGGEPRLGDPVHQPLVLEPVRHQLRHRDEGEPVLLRDDLELGAARHRAVGVQDLADHPRGNEPREPREIHARLGLPHALEHAAGPGAEREDVAGAAEIGRAPWPD